MTKIEPQLYPAEVFWSDDDEGFIAIAPDLPGCSAWGTNEADAIAELRQAISAWVEAATAAGNPIPPPSRPAGLEQFSGKFLVRVPKRLHADLARNANAESVSLNQYVTYLLTEGNTARTVAKQMPYLQMWKYLASARTSGHDYPEFIKTIDSRAVGLVSTSSSTPVVALQVAMHP